MKALLGQKIGMTQILDDQGRMVPVTLLQAGPCMVTNVKTDERDGYMSVQLGYGSSKNTHKPQEAELKKNKIEARPVFIREFRATQLEEVAVGDFFNVDVFEVGDLVSVTGTSKGKGWAGTIKRHNFERQRKTHGAKGHTRRPGSIGSMYPQKVFKGKKMAGRMGGDRVSAKNLTIELVDLEHNVIGVRGAVAGARKGYVMVRGTA